MHAATARLVQDRTAYRRGRTELLGQLTTALAQIRPRALLDAPDTPSEAFVRGAAAYERHLRAILQDRVVER